MNDTEFETHLRGLLRPVAPSAELHGRIHEELSTDVRQPRAYSGRLTSPKRGFLQVLLRDFGWACAGAAAALAIFAMLPAKQTPASPTEATTGSSSTESPATVAQTSTFEHDETTNQLVATEDSEQLVETDDGPAREVRYTYLERHAWSNPTTGARVYLEVPREDVYLLPVSLQ
ncbi:MAG: hypothetical protein ABJF10_14955 [Chthoniobacter sp.]|uniref:hypothetical protein n=1 Tax=Chthoniobacter sp. TaxID=2510640 RepID=UPI0032AD9884